MNSYFTVIRHWTFWRRLVQTGFALLFIIIPILNLYNYHFLTGNLASLNIGSFYLIEPASGLSAAIAGRLFTLTFLLGIVPVVAMMLLLGPIFCSWVCPWGLLSEGLDSLIDRWIQKHFRPKSSQTNSRIRFVVFAGLMLFSFACSIPLVAIISPPRLITTLPIHLIYLSMISSFALIIMAILFFIEIVAPRRLLCRTLCPVGSCANFIRSPVTLTVRFNRDTCHCSDRPVCQESCRWGIDPRNVKLFDGCTNCMACIDVCPTHSLTISTQRNQTVKKS